MIVSKYAPLAALAMLTAGCSFNPIGESTFDCNRKENPSEYCRSFKALEKSTNGVLPESRFDKEFRMSDYDRANGLAPDAPTETKSGKQIPRGEPLSSLLPHNRASQPLEVVPGAPVRRAPVIQRVLIKQFVDENDMLQGDVVVYKEVQASKWTGFDASRAAASGSGQAIYPHRIHDVPAVGGDVPPAATQGSNFVQPEGNAEVAGGTATPPAVSGGK